MAASILHQWQLIKYAKFVFNEDDDSEVVDANVETMDVPSKGKWKVFTGENQELLVSYLESDHFLITLNEIILESFSLINSKTWLKGVAKKDTLLLLNKLKDGSNRRFRIQFAESNDDRKQCTEILKKFFPICDYDAQSKDRYPSEVASINQILLDKLKCRKGYDVDLSDENLKEIVVLCLTDATFPSYVAKIDDILNNIGK